MRRDTKEFIHKFWKEMQIEIKLTITYCEIVIFVNDFELESTYEKFHHVIIESTMTTTYGT